MAFIKLKKIILQKFMKIYIGKKIIKRKLMKGDFYEQTNKSK